MGSVGMAMAFPPNASGVCVRSFAPWLVPGGRCGPRSRRRTGPPPAGWPATSPAHAGGLLLGQPGLSHLRVGEHHLRDAASAEAARERAAAADGVAGRDAAHRVGGVGERHQPGDVPGRVDAMHGGGKVPIDGDRAAFIHADASGIQAEPAGDGHAARRNEQVRRRHLGRVIQVEETAGSDHDQVIVAVHTPRMPRRRSHSGRLCRLADTIP